MDIFKIDSSICDYYSDTKEDEEGANFIVGWCHLNECECSEVPFEECAEKAVALCKLKDKQLDQLKAENEELKKKCNIYTCGICGNKEDCNKLYKTITEIKEIAEHCMKQDICTTCNNSDKCHIEDEEIPTYDVCKLILQKISEVEDETTK